MKKDTIQKFTPLFALFFFMLMVNMGCKDLAEEKREASNLAAAEAPREKLSNWPEPTSHVGEIPVYEKFGDLEPMFNFKNDTTYVINFWATWCKPCIEELPYFEAFNAAHKDKKVKVVLCSLDFPKKLETQLLPFIEKNQLASKVVVLLDGKYNDWIDKVSPEWSGAIPATYIYKEGQNRLVAEPFKNLEELNEAVKPFL